MPQVGYGVATPSYSGALRCSILLTVLDLNSEFPKGKRPQLGGRALGPSSHRTPSGGNASGIRNKRSQGSNSVCAVSDYKPEKSPLSTTRNGTRRFWAPGFERTAQHATRSATFDFAAVMASSAAAAQAPPTPATPAAQTAPPAAAGNAAGCAPTQSMPQQGTIAPQGTTAADPRAEPLGDKLARSDGVLCPPTGVDPEIRAPTPETGNMPVIPPPGSPGGDPTIRPK
jgi:hypothetical protein